MADKKMNPVAKGLILVGILGVTGIAFWAGHKYIYKPWKAKKDSSKTQDTDIVLPNDTNISPKDTTTPIDVKLKSYEDVKKKLISLGGKDYGSYVMYTVPTESFASEPSIADSFVNYQLSAYGYKPAATTLGGRVSAKFQNDTGYRLYFTPNGSNKPLLLHGGLYWNGGKNIKVINDYLNKGKNRNLVIQTTDVIASLKKASKA